MKLFEVLDPVLELRMSDKRLAKSAGRHAGKTDVGFEFECFVSWAKFGDPDVDDYHDDDIVFESVESDIQNEGIDYLWKVEGDGSIVPPEKHTGVEIVTDPIPYKRLSKVLKEYLKWMQQNAGTNESCGLHINVSIAGLHNLDYFKMALFMGEDYMLKLWNRMDTQYAQKHVDDMANMADRKNVLSLGRDTFDKFIERMNRQISTDKYMSFNISKSGYIEFRVAGGEGYENNYEKIMSSINRFIRLIELGSDKNLARKEYMKKVGNFLSKVADKSKTVADDDFGGDVEQTIDNLAAKFIGIRELDENDFQWLIYALWHKEAKISSRVRLALRKYARQADIDEDDFRDRVDQDSRFREDEDHEKFIRYAINLLGLK